MTIAQQVDDYVCGVALGRLFSVDDLLRKKSLGNNRNAVSTRLKRLVAANKVKRLSKGLYYRPKMTRFGSLPIESNEVLKKICSDRKAKFVVAGPAAANALGLSKQLPMVKSYLVTERIRNNFKDANIKLEYSKALGHFTQHLKITSRDQKENALLLWSALSYFHKDVFSEYKEQFAVLFKERLEEKSQQKFLLALPSSMHWVRGEMEEELGRLCH